MNVYEKPERNIHSPPSDNGRTLRDALLVAMENLKVQALIELNKLEVPFRINAESKLAVSNHVAKAYLREVELRLFGRTGVMEESWGEGLTAVK
jgi:hypothetical protein